jgi:arylsulfatase A-like enzyme
MSSPRSALAAAATLALMLASLWGSVARLLFMMLGMEPVGLASLLVGAAYLFGDRLLTCFAVGSAVAFTWLLLPPLVLRAGVVFGRSVSNRTSIRLVGALALGLAGYWLGRDLSSGAWISWQWYSWTIPWGGLLAGLSAGVLLELLIRTLFQTDRRLVLWGLVVLLMLGFALPEYVMVTRLGGLYPSAHFAAETIAAMGALLLAARAATRFSAVLVKARWSFAVLVCSVLTMAAGVGWRFGIDDKCMDRLVAAGIIPMGTKDAGSKRSCDCLVRELRHLASENLEGANSQEDPPIAQRPTLASATLPRQPNIVLIVADAMRADALSPHQPSSRDRYLGQVGELFIERWSQKAVRFETAYTTSSTTNKAMPSLFFSVWKVDEPGMGDRLHLAESLRNAGYRTTAIVHDWFLQTAGWLYREDKKAMLRGFSRIVGFSSKYEESRNTIAKAFKSLGSGQQEPYFVWYQHAWLHDDWCVGCGEDQGGSYPDQYGRKLRLTDRFLEELLTGLDANASRPTVVILTADHGEGLGANGVQFHFATVFEEEVRVPLVIRIPGVDSQDRDDVVGIVDLAPTILELAGAAPMAGAAGRSLVPEILSKEASPPARPLYMENGTGLMGAVVLGSKKMIFDHNSGRILLYDTAKDPAENENIYDPESPLDRSLLRRLVVWRNDMIKQEAATGEAKELLIGILDGISGDHPVKALEFLMSAVVASEDRDCIRAALRLRDRAESTDVVDTIERFRAGRVER